MDQQTVLDQVRALSQEFAKTAPERRLRRQLDRADFDRLTEAGYLLTAVPSSHGGIWEDSARSARPVAEMLRALAHADSSLALVASMHPAVIGFGGWLTLEEAPAPYTQAWAEQRSWVFATARDGAWWGTITSEPGSGGDVLRTKAIARPAGDGAYLLSGEKHFGSGSGVMSYMITTALPESEASPDMFFMDMRDVPWDGSAGVTLTAPWDGQGMTATQSHAMTFRDFPARRAAWSDYQARTAAMRSKGAGLVAALFTAVVTGITEVALDTARRQLGPRHETLRPYEQVEWSRAEMEGWLIQRAYEGVLCGAEQDKPAETLLGKEAVAELAESLLARLSRILGGGTFSRQSPFGFWFEDVRALGFLRPPWGLAYDNIFAASWEA
jgi:alkylation response protein AidB-like acyl-CoA dehydrogenase